jgi:hypothetical protein
MVVFSYFESIEFLQILNRRFYYGILPNWMYDVRLLWPHYTIIADIYKSD